MLKRYWPLLIPVFMCIAVFVAIGMNPTATREPIYAGYTASPLQNAGKSSPEPAPKSPVPESTTGSSSSSNDSSTTSNNVAVTAQVQSALDLLAKAGLRSTTFSMKDKTLSVTVDADDWERMSNQDHTLAKRAIFIAWSGASNEANGTPRAGGYSIGFTI